MESVQGVLRCSFPISGYATKFKILEKEISLWMNIFKKPQDWLICWPLHLNQSLIKIWLLLFEYMAFLWRHSSTDKGRGQNAQYNDQTYNKSKYKKNWKKEPNQFGNKPMCQIWEKIGHNAKTCYRYTNMLPKDQRGTRPQAYVAAPSSNSNASDDDTWYPDLGASYHITNDIDILSLYSSYHGMDEVKIGNGLGLSIQHIGSSCVSNNFNLNDILHVPRIKKI
ncbi:hypothetical protein EJ110_NYTH31419 [Nymphaea thermarum]|nr:hypothetical protein EJ110_NYTH31419 [Nymphaea thermarum]